MTAGLKTQKVGNHCTNAITVIDLSSQQAIISLQGMAEFLLNVLLQDHSVWSSHTL